MGIQVSTGANVQVREEFQYALGLSAKKDRHLVQRFFKNQANFSFSVGPDVYKAMMEPLIPAEAIARTWVLWDGGRNRPHIDVLRVLAGHFVVGQAPFDTKIREIFALFDFDDSQTITRDESIIMLRQTLHGFCVLTDRPMPPVEHVAALCQRAFEETDVDRSGSISLQELTAWCRGSPTVARLLCRFGTSDSQEVLTRIAEIERNRSKDESKAGDGSAYSFSLVNHRKWTAKQRHTQLPADRRPIYGEMVAMAGICPPPRVRELKAVFDRLDVAKSGHVPLAAIIREIEQHTHISDDTRAAAAAGDSAMTFGQFIACLMPWLSPRQVAITQVWLRTQPATKTLVGRIRMVFDMFDAHCTGRVLLSDVVPALKSSQLMLNVLGFIQPVSRGEMNRRVMVSLPQLLARLFTSSHPRQLHQILQWGTPSKPVSEAVRRDIQELYDLLLAKERSEGDPATPFLSRRAFCMEVRSLYKNGHKTASLIRKVEAARPPPAINNRSAGAARPEAIPPPDALSFEQTVSIFRTIRALQLPTKRFVALVRSGKTGSAVNSRAGSAQGSSVVESLRAQLAAQSPVSAARHSSAGASSATSNSSDSHVITMPGALE